jgi:hypothetical protein
MPLIAATASYAPSDRVSISWEKGLISAVTRYDAAADERGVPVDYAVSGVSPTTARMDAYGKARDAAKEMIASAIRDIKVDGASTVGSILDTDPMAQVRAAQLIDEKIRSTENPCEFLAAQCSASLKISELASALPFDYPCADFPTGQENPLATVYTSLILDLRGRGVSPMLFPSVYDQDGLEIYGRRYVSMKTACSKGLVRWCTDEKSARKMTIAGEHPYYTTAVSTLNGSPVLSRTDSRRILSHKRTIERLRSCAVIFIIDTPKTKREGAAR